MERRTKQHDRETVLISSYHESFLVTICAPIISKSTVKTRKILITANYKNTTLFRNIFKNATPIFQKYHTREITHPGSWDAPPYSTKPPAAAPVTAPVSQFPARPSLGYKQA